MQVSYPRFITFKGTIRICSWAWGITHVFEKIFRLGKVPKAWIKGKIIPNFQKCLVDFKKLFKSYFSKHLEKGIFVTRDKLQVHREQMSSLPFVMALFQRDSIVRVYLELSVFLASDKRLRSRERCWKPSGAFSILTVREKQKSEFRSVKEMGSRKWGEPDVIWASQRLQSSFKSIYSLIGLR